MDIFLVMLSLSHVHTGKCFLIRISLCINYVHKEVLPLRPVARIFHGGGVHTSRTGTKQLIVEC